MKLASLKSQRDLYFYDQVGGGQSSKLDEKYWTPSTFVDELNIIIKRLKIKDYDIFAVSWGCLIALEFCLKSPQGLNKVILQSPLVDSNDWQKDADILVRQLKPAHQKIIQYCNEIEATDSQVYQQTLMKYYEKHVLRNKKILYSKKKRSTKGKSIYQAMWGPSEFSATGSLKKYTFKNKLKKLKQKILFVAGEYDEARPETVSKYARQVKGSDFKAVKNTSHCIALENPKALIKIIKTFFDFN